MSFFHFLFVFFVVTPRGALVHHPDDPGQVTVMASNNQVPIKLEISLNPKQMSDLVAKGVQTGNLPLIYVIT